jgi:hypothetical protein
VSSPGKKSSAGSSSQMQMLQSALDYERSEFSRLLDSRKKEIEEKNETVSRIHEGFEQIIRPRFMAADVEEY